MASSVSTRLAGHLRARNFNGCAPVWHANSRAVRANLARSYTASAQKPASHLKSASSPKTNAKKAAKPKETVLNNAAAQVEETQASTTKATGGQRDVSEMTDEEKLEQLKQMSWYMQRFPTLDLWGQKSDKLDVAIPHPVLFGADKSYSSMTDRVDQLKANWQNSAKNAASMYLMAKENAFDGVDTGDASFFQKYLTQWPWRMFSASSTSSGAWLDQTRKNMMDSYLKLNEGLAKKDLKAIEEYATGEHLARMRKILKKQKTTGYTYVWRLHREVAPPRIVSLRATEGFGGPGEPKLGNKLFINALMRVETEQSLEIYDRNARPLHKIAEGATTSPGNAPAERTKMTEYLLFQKRCWYDAPWVIRDQMDSEEPAQ